MTILGSDPFMSTQSDEANRPASSPAIPPTPYVAPHRKLSAQLSQLIKGYTLALAGALLVIVIAFAAVLAPVVSPYDPIEMNLDEPIQPPSTLHLFGTDSFGRDVLTRIIYGSRVTLLVGTVSVTVALLLGLPIGVLAGYAGGLSDRVLMRAMDALLAFPPIILAIVLVSTFGPSTVNAMLALGIVYAPQIARVIRSTTLGIKEEVYVTAAHTIGVPTHRIIWRYLLPNANAPVIVQATSMFAYAIIAEATLSFLGLGTQPPTPSWGEMVSSGRAYMQQAYWVVLFPALAIVLFVVGVNFAGDGIRDGLDPRYRRSMH